MDIEAGPIIIVSGVSTVEATASHELRRRGFIIKHSLTRNSSLNYAVSMSKRLTAKLAAEINVPIQPIFEYTPLVQINLANHATHIVMRAAAIKPRACWVAHDHRSNEIAEKMSGPKKDAGAAIVLINGYYGPQVALYFGFLDFYTKNLFPAMLGGALLFAHQIIYNEIDSVWLPIFCLGITLWSTFYLERWKRHCAELAYAWGVYGSEDRELTAELAKGASKEVSSVEFRRTLSAFGVLFLIYIQVLLMLYYNHTQAHSAEYFGTYWYSSIVPHILYFALCNLSSAIFYPISSRLNDFEMHATKAQAENSLVVKRFAFNFVNQFSVLLYAAFWQKDLQRVRSLSIYSFIIHAATNQFLLFSVPKIKALYKYWKLKAGGAQDPDDGADEVCRFDDSKYWDNFLRREIKRPEVDLQDDYLEMAVQFGQLSMFAVAFPLAPLLAYANNIWEIGVDFKKLSEARRPPVVIRSSIGAWLTCLQCLSFASVFTNCYLLAMVSTNITAILPQMVHSHLDSDYGRLVAMMVVEHLLIAFKIGIMVLVDDVPQWMQESLAREKVRLENARLNSLFGTSDGTGDAQPSETDQSGKQGSGPSTPYTPRTPGTAAGGTSAGTPMARRGSMFLPSMPSLMLGSPAANKTPKSFIEEQLASEEALLSQNASDKNVHKRTKAVEKLHSEAAVHKLVKECNSQYGFDPLNMSVLVAVPPLIQHLGFNPFFYIPLAVMYFSYLQAAKDRSDRKTALGIVSDPGLIKLVVKDLPRWVSDSEHQRVEWFNSLLQKLWPQLSHALESTMISEIQAILNAQVIAVRVGLTVKRFSLGSVSPKIVSVRLHETQESIVRLDVEIRWAGDPLLCINVGQYNYAPPVEVSEVRLSAIVRIELLELMPALPCFRAMSVTCMKKPEVHFSLKVASLDFMNMGPADFNVTSLVRTAIDSVLEDIVVYPKKILVPLVVEGTDDTAVDQDDSGSAVGVLYLTFEKGVNIKKAGVFGSNPYVTARTDKGQSFRSKAVYGSRNPEWDQTFELLVFDPTNQVVEVQVLDADPTRLGVSLGRLNFGLSKLKVSQTVRKTISLMEVDVGALVISYEYIPMLAPDNTEPDSDDAEEDPNDEDVLFGFKAPDLANDVLCKSEEELQSLSEHRARRQSRQSRASLANFTPPNIGDAAEQNTSNTEGEGSTKEGNALRKLRRISHVVVSQRFAAKFSVGIVSVSMIHVRNLKIDSFFLAASCRPYVELAIGAKVKKTKPQPGTTFPHFPEKFSFIVKDLAQQLLVVSVKNRHKMSADKVIGTVDISLSEVVVNGGTLEQEYILNGAHAEFYVGLRIVVTASSS